MKYYIYIGVNPGSHLRLKTKVAMVGLRAWAAGPEVCHCLLSERVGEHGPKHGSLAASRE